MRLRPLFLSFFSPMDQTSLLSRIACVLKHDFSDFPHCQGLRVMTKFRRMLNPRQVCDLAKGGPGTK